MIVEERCYILKAEASPAAYLARYKETGALEIQTGILGNLIGYFVSEIGELNSVVHLWGYASFEERARRRVLLSAEPVWQAYLTEIRPLIQTMTNRLLVPADFSPIK